MTKLFNNRTTNQSTGLTELNIAHRKQGRVASNCFSINFQVSKTLFIHNNILARGCRFFFSMAQQILTRSLSSLVRYPGQHSK